MASEIKSHRPGLKILVTKRKKSTLVSGRGGGESSSETFDLAPALGDKGACTVTKNMYAYHGEFHIIMPDMPFDFGGDDGIKMTSDSPYGLVEPMDVVEIQMDRDVKPDMPVVMRGLVRSVGRDETVGEDGRPMRRVSIVGHDFGCIFTISQLWLRVGLRDGDVVDPKYAYLKAFDLISAPVTIENFMTEFLRFANEAIKSTGISVEPAFDGVPGSIVPTTLPSLEGPLWMTMIRFADSPWNELFVRDPLGDGPPELVFRETPWKTKDGDFIKFQIPPPRDKDGNVIEKKEFSANQGSSVQIFEVDMANVLSISAHRDDSGVANFIWVDMPTAWSSLHWEQLISPHAQEIAEKTKEDANSTKEIYGDRLLSQASYIGPGVAASSLPKKDQEEAEISWLDWRNSRIDWLHEATNDNADFEQGSITIKGDPTYQVGNYLKLKRGVPWEGYMIGVTHEFRPYRDYLTTIDFIRGTGFIERVKKDNPWDLERKSAEASDSSGSSESSGSWEIKVGEGVKTS